MIKPLNFGDFQAMKRYSYNQLFLKKTCVLVPACLNICEILKYKRYLKARDRGGTDGLGE